MDKLIGREKEIQLLTEFTSSDRPEFVAIYGRRRVGKTFLVNHLFHGKMAFIFVQTPCSMLASSPALKQLPELARRHADDVKKLAVVGAHHSKAGFLGTGGDAP